MFQSALALSHVNSGEVVDLWIGQITPDRTAALVKRSSFEAVRLVVQAGREIPWHRVPKELTLYCVAGHVVLRLETGDIQLRAGEWVFLEGEIRHAVAAHEDSTLLLTILL